MQAFNHRPSYPSARLPVFGRDVVSTSHPLAAQVGLRMLQDGGNAIDAAIAAAATLTVVEPCSNGLGSDAFAIVWDGTQLQGLNASGRAPADWSAAAWRARQGDAMALRGWDSVTVPGAVSAWAALSQRYGRLPFADLLAPAAEIAERGYAVPVVVAEKWALAAQTAALVSQPGFAQTFLPGGRAPQAGELFRLSGAARALRSIGATQGESFYRGEIAAAIVRQSRAQGGVHTLDDFASHQPEWVDTLSQRYRGHVLHEIPPNGQGLAALMALGICAQFDMAALPVDGVACQHLQIEAMKLAFADVYRHVAERSAMRVTTEQLLAPDYLAARARLIDMRRAQDFGPGAMPQGGTVYLSAADASGRMVSLIQSNYMGFGSGVVVPEWGVSLHNRGAGFSLDPLSPNAVAGGKRPFHTILPAFLTDADGTPRMSFGVMGGHMQPQGQLQTLVRMLDHGQGPQMACDAPRWRVNPSGTLNLEPHTDPDTAAGLAALGHRIEALVAGDMDFGAGQFIWRLGDPAVDGYVAASDPRRDGLVAAC